MILTTILELPVGEFYVAFFDGQEDPVFYAVVGSIKGGKANSKWSLGGGRDNYKEI